MFLVKKAALDSKAELHLRSIDEDPCPFVAPELGRVGGSKGQVPHQSPPSPALWNTCTPHPADKAQSHLRTPVISEDLNHRNCCQDASRENTSNQCTPSPTWATSKGGFLGWRWVDIGDKMTYFWKHVLHRCLLWGVRAPADFFTRFLSCLSLI